MGSLKFVERLDAKRPILQLGRFRLRFDTHMLVGTYRPALDWLRFAPELALLVFASSAVLTAVLLILPGEESGAIALPTGLVCIAAALVALRLEIHKRRRRGFVFNYATRTLRLDDTTRLWGTTRTQLIPFSQIEEAGVTQPAPGRYAFEIQLKPEDAGSAPKIEVLLSDVPARELEDLFRLSDMARAAFGLTPPEPTPPEE